MEFLQAFSAWVVVVGNVETKTGVGCIHQQLANHDKGAQFIHKGFLVIGQTTAKRQSYICKYTIYMYPQIVMQYKKCLHFKLKAQSTYMKEQPRAATKLRTGKV